MPAPTFTFAPAVRREQKARIALAGPSGSGKTWTSLALATAMCKRIAVIDTEKGSAALYAGPGGYTFDHLKLTRYEPQTLIAALAAATTAGYDGVIIDSLSHFWMGTGGMLEQVDDVTKRSRSQNSFSTGWKEMSPVEQRMLDALTSYPGHVFVTMRTKTEWIIDENEHGKKMPRKIGLKPEQRAGIEYEFTVVGDMDQQNTLVVSKTRCSPLQEAVIRKPGADMAITILDWLNEGETAGPGVLEYVDRVTAATTRDELLALLDEIKAERLHGAAIQDDTGEAVTLEEYVIARGRAVATAGAS